MVLDTILITGGSGFVAQHLIRYLQENASHKVKEIRCVDRQKFTKFLDYPNNIAVKHFTVDLKKGCEKELSAAFSGVSTVFHCARKAFEYLHNLENDFHDEYFRDNLATTELVLEAMERQKVPYLVFLGDAYANIPVGDNYGVSEEAHAGIPKSYVLGDYGESVIRAELAARRAVKEEREDGYELKGIFLRPTLVYGEGHTSLTKALIVLCKQYKNLPNIDGFNRGLHQFIYAGNLAGMMFAAMLQLQKNPKKCNGEYMYCMDSPGCVDFKNFIRPYVEASNCQMNNDVKYLQAFLISFYHEICYRIGSKQSEQQLSLLAMRFLFGWSIGFSNRKLRLLLAYFSEYDQVESMKKTVDWFAKRDQVFVEKPRLTGADRIQG
ncbi:hypothetical protein L596_002371 [Steinernema carpocapsae]|uniref:3-beta hydroxysteroid dehydrogenase/isomerase domain-containing protein n=1 Tax=Steinernema carpocapsae TaxID=34508 RepID=A0A4U8UP39_STECR|nr:hypothetical protein L596_002371 [Steinernema carpocapsae]